MIKTKFLSLVLSLCMILSISAYAAPSLNLGDFDYANVKIAVSADTGNALVSEAVIYIYSDGNLSDGNPPLYMDYVVLSAGTLSERDILMPNGFDYGTYTVALYYNDGTSPLTEDFSYYSPADLLNARKAQILSEAKEVIFASDASKLEAVLFDVSSAGGTKLPTNDVIVRSEANLLDDYKVVSNKIEVYKRMIDEKHVNCASYDALIALFKKCAKDQRNAENNPVVPPTDPGTDNTGTGNVTGSITTSGSTGSSSGSVSFGGSAAGGYAAPVFPDMQGHWAEKYAKVLSDKKIINGYADGTFKGENNVTRAEVTKMIVSAFNIYGGDNSYTYTDVADGSWYSEYVIRASAAGIVTGYLGLFNPDGNITRQDAALIAYRALSTIKEVPNGSTSFKDEKNIAAYAIDAVKALGDAKVLTGDTEGNFNPTAPITRAEIAAVLCRALDWAQLN